MYQDVGGSLGYEVGSGDGEHIRSPTETIREEENVSISSCRDWKWSKIVDADGYSGAVGQRNGECRPADGLAGCFPRLALEASPDSPFGAHFHTYPPIEAL